MPDWLTPDLVRTLVEVFLLLALGWVGRERDRVRGILHVVMRAVDRSRARHHEGHMVAMDVQEETEALGLSKPTSRELGRARRDA